MDPSEKPWTRQQWKWVRESQKEFVRQLRQEFKVEVDGNIRKSPGFNVVADGAPFLAFP